MAKRPARKTIAPPAADISVAQMVLIDQRPLRSEAGTQCQEAMARLEKARTIWHRFERKDKPAFIRWRAREFGALLSKARDVEVQIREHESLVYEVEMEMRRTIVDPHSAYQRVMFRRANPAAANEAQPDREPDSGRRVTEFEQEALFQDWVKKFIGTNPDKMDDEAYDASFHAFKSHMFASRKEEPAPNENRRASQRRPAEVEKEIVPPTDARVKELYRLLVRRLHPDLRSDGNATVSSLWHEVQEAYELGDVGRMEILLALSDIQSNAVGDQTTLAQMRLVREELERALDALERSLHEAERDDAWDFARKGADDTSLREVQRELERNLVVRTARLATLQKILAEWANPPGPSRRITLARAFA